MEIERYDNLFFPRTPEKTFIINKKTFIISRLSAINLWLMGNISEKNPGPSTVLGCTSREKKRTGFLLMVNWRKKERWCVPTAAWWGEKEIREETARKQAAAIQYLLLPVRYTKALRHSELLVLSDRLQHQT